MARLVYLGTPEAAVQPLQTLVTMGHDVALVVSRPDKRRGRGNELIPSPVKAAAVELGLTVTDSLDDVLQAEADLGVVVAYGRIIPSATLAHLAMVNLHFSLLPRWRGAAPVERALLEGDAETGVCLMAVDVGLDTGAIYAQASTEIDQHESAETLRHRLVALGCELLETFLPSGPVHLPLPREQAGEPSYAEKLRSEEFHLHWDRRAEEIDRVVRLGRAWTIFRGKRFRIVRSVAIPRAEGQGLVTIDGPVGSLQGDVVLCHGGSLLRLLVVQPEGKEPMDAAAWLRGLRPDQGQTLVFDS